MPFPDPVVLDSSGNPLTAAQIAQSVTGSTSGILNPAGIASQLNTVGVPPTDVNTLLIDFNALYGGTFLAATALNSSIINVANYNSIRYTLGETQFTVGARRWLFTWYDSIGGGSTIGQDVIWSPIYAGKIVGTIPCRGPFLQVGADGTTNAGTPNPCKIYGSYRSIPKATYFVLAQGNENASNLMGTNGFGDSGFFNLSGAFVNNMVDFPRTRAGAAHLFCELFSVTTSVAKVQLRTLSGNRIITELLFPVNATSQVATLNFTLPFGPVEVLFSLSATNSTGNLGLTSVEY
jgi:hypothetical protein